MSPAERRVANAPAAPAPLPLIQPWDPTSVLQSSPPGSIRLCSDWPPTDLGSGRALWAARAGLRVGGNTLGVPGSVLGTTREPQRLLN